jgi:hypothetical protein
LKSFPRKTGKIVAMHLQIYRQAAAGPSGWALTGRRGAYDLSITPVSLT